MEWSVGPDTDMIDLTVPFKDTDSVLEPRPSGQQVFCELQPDRKSCHSDWKISHDGLAAEVQDLKSQVAALRSDLYDCLRTFSMRPVEQNDQDAVGEMLAQNMKKMQKDFLERDERWTAQLEKIYCLIRKDLLPLADIGRILEDAPQSSAIGSGSTHPKPSGRKPGTSRLQVANGERSILQSILPQDLISGSSDWGPTCAVKIPCSKGDSEAWDKEGEMLQDGTDQTPIMGGCMAPQRVRSYTRLVLGSISKVSAQPCVAPCTNSRAHSRECIRVVQAEDEEHFPPQPVVPCIQTRECARVGQVEHEGSLQYPPMSRDSRGVTASQTLPPGGCMDPINNKTDRHHWQT
jgi:hypothetical protein